jgi:transposase
MENAEDLSLPQMAALLGTSQEVQFAAKGRREVYEWVEQVLVRQEYALQGKKTKGVVRAYLAKMTGKSLPQITRLVRQYRETGQVRGQDYRRRRFVRLCTEADVRLLAKVDRAHQRLSGPATRRILEREVGVYGHQEYVRLAQISVGHLYNLRKRPDYRKQVALYEVTRPTQVSIAERRRPDPQGRPGYLRVDTVHQGDWDGHKGVYHINSVDAVTQWEAAGCIPIISAESLKPLLEALMAQHPVPILGFHVDNGRSTNHMVAKLLGDSLVEFTKSRAYQSCDNALVEGKNGAIIRKHIGYGHIAPEHAVRIREFYVRYLNPYLNYHRPCGFATVTVDTKGKRRRKYPLANYATPYEKLKPLREGGAVLRPELSWEALEQITKSASDTEFAERMRRAKIDLLRQCKMESPVPPRWEVGR